MRLLAAHKGVSLEESWSVVYAQPKGAYCSLKSLILTYSPFLLYYPLQSARVLIFSLGTLCMPSKILIKIEDFKRNKDILKILLFLKEAIYFYGVSSIEHQAKTFISSVTISYAQLLSMRLQGCNLEGA